jgi:hypothetical protein
MNLERKSRQIYKVALAFACVLLVIYFMVELFYNLFRITSRNLSPITPQHLPGILCVGSKLLHSILYRESKRIIGKVVFPSPASIS